MLLALMVCRDEVESKMKLTDSSDKLSTNCCCELRWWRAAEKLEQLQGGLTE
jgi:hypothetical protein